jgi:hypothetical protein
VFETLNGCRVIVAAFEARGLPPAMEEGPTLREVVWGVESEDDLERYAAAHPQRGRLRRRRRPRRIGCTDPNGLAVRFQVTRKRAVEVDQRRIQHLERARPREPGQPRVRTRHAHRGGPRGVLRGGRAACERFYARTSASSRPTATRATAAPSCAARPRAATTTCSCCSGRTSTGLNHVAFTVRDIHEVFGGGMHISRCGWQTQLGPGRHPVSSAYFWYFQNPAGGLIEYYADEDQLTADWEPREFEPGPTVFAEWAIDGGIDGNTRRQKSPKRPRAPSSPTASKTTTCTFPFSKFALAALAAFTLPRRARAGRAQRNSRKPFTHGRAVPARRPGRHAGAHAGRRPGQAQYKQTAIVENKPGAAGNIGIDQVKRSEPSGHTLLVIPAGNLTINPTLMPNARLDILGDFAPVSSLARAPTWWRSTPRCRQEHRRTRGAWPRASPTR